MARRSLLVVKKQKKKRITISEQYLVNHKYMGDEPSPQDKRSANMLSNINWYNMMCTIDDAREYIRDYLKASNRAADIKKFNKVPDCWVPTTAAWIARMGSRQFSLSEDMSLSVDRLIARSLEHAQQTTIDTSDPAKSTVSIQQRVKEKSYDILAEIEEMIDQGRDWSLYEWLKKNDIPATYMNPIIMKYSQWLDELIQALEKTDPQLVEGYKNFTTKQLKNEVLFFHKLIEDAQRYGSVTKKTRAPRKPRPVSIEKKLKSLKYQKEDNQHKIASINPEKIVGAQELWTFNTRSKVITVFRALDRGGLQVKGTSIIGYNEKTSATKKTGRKTEELVKRILSGGKVVLRKLMDEIKTDGNFTNRINDSTILLRVC